MARRQQPSELPRSGVAFRRWRWVAGAVLAALAALAALVQAGATGLALAAAMLTAAAAALGPEVMAWLREREATEDARELEIRDLLIRWPLTAEKAHPWELGVPESKIANQYRREAEQPPYIARDQDGELRRALSEHSFVLLVGPSKAGKSRTAVEALRDKDGGLCHQPLIVPVRPSDNRDALRSLTGLRHFLPLGAGPAVLWLDDIDEYLRARALTATLLRKWRAGEPEVIVLATIREGALADLRGLETEQATAEGGAIGKTTGEVLDQAEQVHLRREPSSQELARGSRLYPGQDFTQGIGTSLIDAPRLVDRLRTGRTRCAEGVAVVRAAVDWRRVGGTRRATKDDLTALLPLYLGDIAPSRDALDRGLAWAEERLDSGAALLRRSPDGPGYEAHDYVVDFVDGRAHGTDRRDAIPRAAWTEVLRRVGPDDAVAVGYAAYSQPDAPIFEVAERAWVKATHSHDPDSCAMAWFYLGALLTRTRRVRQAEDAYRRALESGHQDAAPLAALNLGVLLEGQDAKEFEAESAYRLAIASGHPDAAPRAAAVLGLFLSGQSGREDEARAAFEEAIASNHEGAASTARKYLARLLDPSRRGTRR